MPRMWMFALGTAKARRRWYSHCQVCMTCMHDSIQQCLASVRLPASLAADFCSTTAVCQWLRVRQPTVAVGAWYKLRMCSAEACCWLISKSWAVNSSWYVVSYTGMQLTAFLPNGIVVRLPAALLACFSLQHHVACHACVSSLPCPE